VPPPNEPATTYRSVVAPRRSREASEIGLLYGTGIAYGVGLGVWIDAELGIGDPAASLIAPAVLGLGAPIGVYFLDSPAMPRGVPSAMAFGMLIGAGEGLGVAGLQFVTADEADAWGFRGLSRSVALGATLGGAAGWAVGYYEEPSPKLSAFVGSGTAWGTLIGASVGYGVSGEGIGYGQANDSAALGGLIGFNAGLGAAAGLSTLFVPSWYQLGWMWGGAAIGGAASLPVFLLYLGDGSPPAKRGLVFTGTAIGLGAIAGGLLTSGEVETQASGVTVDDEPLVQITSVAPLAVEAGAGVSVGGSWY
jgi:hypothetical protein